MNSPAQMVKTQVLLRPVNIVCHLQDLVNEEISWLDSGASKHAAKHWGLTKEAAAEVPGFHAQEGHDSSCRLCALKVIQDLNCKSPF